MATSISLPAGGLVDTEQGLPREVKVGDLEGVLEAKMLYKFLGEGLVLVGSMLVSKLGDDPLAIVTAQEACSGPAPAAPAVTVAFAWARTFPSILLEEKASSSALVEAVSSMGGSAPMVVASVDAPMAMPGRLGATASSVTSWVPRPALLPGAESLITGDGVMLLVLSRISVSLPFPAAATSLGLATMPPVISLVRVAASKSVGPLAIPDRSSTPVGLERCLGLARRGLDRVRAEEALVADNRELGDFRAGRVVMIKESWRRG